jgi:bacillithiol biosynthesis cysteine-adding enzyme BshC
MLNLKETRASKFYYNKLYHAFIDGNESILKYFHYNFHNPGDIVKRAEYVSSSYGSSIRQQISGMLEQYNVEIGCSEETVKNCRYLVSNNCMVVAGGQQPGLFTGPVFIIYKIMSVIKLSSFLSGLLKTRVIPVFWNASDDSNFSQIDRAFLFNNKLDEIRIGYPGIENERAAVQGTGEMENGRQETKRRFSDIVLGKDYILGKISEFMDMLPATDFTPSIKKLLEDSAGSGKYGKFGSISDNMAGVGLTPSIYFSRLVTRLFADSGLVIIDPAIDGLKKLGIDLVKKDIRDSDLIYELIHATGNDLEKEGYHSQLSRESHVLDFFMTFNGKRQKVKKLKFSTGSKMLFSIGTGDKKNSLMMEHEEFEDFITSNPEKLSFNVILRPLLQDSILPVVCTICGPGEAAYFAQIKGVYELLGTRQPVIYPRFSATVIENKLGKSFARSGITFDELELDKSEIIKRIVRTTGNTGYHEGLKDMEMNLKSGIAEIKQSLEKNNIDIGKAAEHAKSVISRELKSLENRIASETLLKDNIKTSDLQKIYENIFPRGQMQERMVNVFNYINKYDFAFLRELYDIIDPLSFTHKFIEIS